MALGLQQRDEGEVAVAPIAIRKQPDRQFVDGGFLVETPPHRLQTLLVLTQDSLDTLRETVEWPAMAGEHVPHRQ